MASFNKFNQFAEDLGLGVHNLNTDTLKVYLTNAAPDAAADLVKADLAEISAGNGYTAGGVDVQNVFSETGGTYPRFFFVHNETPAIATGKVVIGWTRLTSGAGHVANTDWAALYATNS